MRALRACLCARLFIHGNKDVLRHSTSGGAFSAISGVVLTDGGAVIGALMTDDFTIKHEIATSFEQRDHMRGSLYAQSDVGLIYREVQALLTSGRRVLFVGTPCQVAGLQSYLGRSYENLVLVDFLCHGVPSVSFFREHIKWLEERYGRRAIGYTFRSKRFGWQHGIEEIEFSDGTRKSNLSVQTYNHFFHRNISLRASCLSCRYRRVERSSDLTIGDFWDVKRILGERCIRGASLILVNTERGERVLEEIAPLGRLVEAPLVQVQARIARSPLSVKGDREAFWRDYRELGYAGLIARWVKRSRKRAVRYYTGRWFKRILGILFGVK